MRIALFVFAVSMVFAPGFVSAQSNCEGCSPGLLSGEQYRPDDPWTRGRIWLRQTGHFGLFYNCDCEEKKRNSPFICWKKSDSPFPGGRLLKSLQSDWWDMRQRILDGTECCCGDRRKREPGKSCHCGGRQPQHNSVVLEAVASSESAASPARARTTTR